MMVAFVPPVRSALDSLLPLEPLHYGKTIWGYDPWRIPMPSEPEEGMEQRGIASAVGYATVHPVRTSVLMLARVVAHFAQVRPFYALAHNLVIVVWLVPVYALAVRGC